MGQERQRVQDGRTHFQFDRCWPIDANNDDGLQVTAFGFVQVTPGGFALKRREAKHSVSVSWQEKIDRRIAHTAKAVKKNNRGVGSACDSFYMATF